MGWLAADAPPPIYLVNGLDYSPMAYCLGYWLPADMNGLLEPCDFCVKKGLDVFCSGARAPAVVTGFYCEDLALELLSNGDLAASSEIAEVGYGATLRSEGGADCTFTLATISGLAAASFKPGAIEDVLARPGV